MYCFIKNNNYIENKDICNVIKKEKQINASLLNLYNQTILKKVFTKILNSTSIFNIDNKL